MMQQSHPCPIEANSCWSVVKWIRQTFPYYPNCRRVSSMSDIRNGVAIGQILTQIVPEQYHEELLSGIEVSITDADRCVGNWRVIRKVLDRYVDEYGIGGMQVRQYRGEGLYYRFVGDVVMRLWQNKQVQGDVGKVGMHKKENISYSNTIMAHILSDQQQPNPNHNHNHNHNHNTHQIPPSKHNSNNPNNPNNHNKHRNTNINTKDKKQANNNNNNNNTNNNNNVNISQLSDIANTSYPNIYEGKIINIEYQQPQQQQHHQEQEQEQEQPVGNSSPPIPLQHIQQLQEWVLNKLSLPRTHQYEPHQLLGQLINNIFCSSRLNDYIIKQAHFQHGALFVYRKVLQFLINSNQADKITRTNTLDMFKSIEEEGVVRQMQYWRVIQDIHNFDRMKGRNIHTSAILHNTNTIPKNQSKQKQNMHPNMVRKNSTKTLSKCKTSKQSINTHMTTNTNSTYLNFKYNMKDIKEAEGWLVKQLGLEHTVSKIYGEGDVWGNGLLNGVLVASVLMRLKIGKVIVNKNAENMGQVKNNWDLINKACNLRGYQSFKVISTLLHNIPPNPNSKLLINIFLHILNQFRLQHNKKYPSLVQPSTPQNCINCPPQTCLIKSYNTQEQAQQKQELANWLSQVFSIQINKQNMSVGQLTQICRQLLSINIYKETTKKIQENNVEKILGEMRRIGLADYYQVKKGDVMNTDDTVRWRILADLKWVIDGKIQFCRA